jgi:hypothetical protein
MLFFFNIDEVKKKKDKISRFVYVLIKKHDIQFFFNIFF